MATTLCIVIIISAALFVSLTICVLRGWKLNQEFDVLEGKNSTLVSQMQKLQATVTSLEGEKAKTLGWLEHADGELNYYKNEIETRLKRERKAYKILTLGLKETGKSSLTLKWANCRVDLNTIEGTKIERYERTVSRVRVRDTLVEHVFEIHDWGGEHIVDAQQELIIEEVHGLLMVVDLGGKDAQQVDMKRIAEQLEEFNPRTVKYFFSPKTVASCKTVVLFINKSDLIPCAPAQAEVQARALYAPLIESLQRYGSQTHVKVLVGSASYGHSTHLLFSHFVDQILPQSAYDNELVQQKKAESQVQPVAPNGKSSAPSQPARVPEAPVATIRGVAKPPPPPPTGMLPPTSPTAHPPTAPLMNCGPIPERGKV